MSYNDLHLGKSESSANEKTFKGNIFQFKIYGRVFTGEEVKDEFLLYSPPIYSCSDMKRRHLRSVDGLYTLNSITGEQVTVFCDMSVDNGGWTLVHHGYGSNGGDQMSDDLYDRTMLFSHK